MTLSMIYRRSVVYPAILLIPLVTIYSIIDNWNYKSEWMTADAVVGMTIIFAFFYGLIICLLALTIFLNWYNKISSNRILSAVSWFLVPGGFICLVYGKAINEYLTVGSVSEIIYASFCNLPFLAGLVWGFCKYRKDMRSAFEATEVQEKNKTDASN